MLTLAFTIKHHSTIRLEELAAALGAIAGAAIFLGAMTPMGRRGGEVFGGLCLAAAGVLAVIALHWGM